MLPTSSSSTKGRSGPSPRPNLLPHYLRRIVKWQQMDIEYTFWQMLHLCTSPKVVYQHTKYHKQTKNQWARDDPAFVVMCSLLLSVSTIAYCAAYVSSTLYVMGHWVLMLRSYVIMVEILLTPLTTFVCSLIQFLILSSSLLCFRYDHSTAHAVFVVISVLLFHFLVTGAILATVCWLFTNNYLREEVPNSHVVEQRVEWLYAFDVHCSSFFPMFLLLYVVNFFLSPILIAHGFVPVLLSNLLFMAAISYYHYLNFLGYDVLPFLERTTFFLYPIGVIIVLSPILILCGFNPSRYFMNMYFSRLL
ncbi:hypothetical protein ACS0TY_002672 [Phlomoides rotata]